MTERHFIVYDKIERRNRAVVDVMTDAKGRLRFRFEDDPAATEEMSDNWRVEGDTLEAETVAPSPAEQGGDK